LRAGWNATARSAFIIVAQAFTLIHVVHSSFCVAGEAAGEPIGRAVAGVISGFKEKLSMNATKVLGLAAVGAFFAVAAPVKQAQAVTLSNPAAAAAVQEDATLGSKQMTTEVGWHHHWHHHRHWRGHRH